MSRGLKLMTDRETERQKKARQRAAHAAAGLERVEVWVRPEWKEFLRAMVKLMNEWRT